jgi:glycerol-3-phosphate dehydrogenase
LFESSSGLLTAAGGKYTTYRHMAEEITNVIAQRLGCHRPCKTREFPLDGTPCGLWERFVRRESGALARRHDLAAEAACHLVDRYGRRAAEVAAYLDDYPALAKPVVAGEPNLQVEFLYHREHEMAIEVRDFLLRRTRLGLFHPELLEKRPPGLK